MTPTDVPRETLREGWTDYGGSSRKWHYVTDADGDGRSLCGKWARSPFAAGVLHVADGKDESPDNCAECKRRKAKRDV